MGLKISDLKYIEEFLERGYTVGECINLVKTYDHETLEWILYSKLPGPVMDTHYLGRLIERKKEAKVSLTSLD